MTQLSPSLRRAAVLISALDAPSADAILQQMSDEDAAKVRSAVVELDDIAPEEQQQVLADFLRQQGGSSTLDSDGPDDVTLDLDPAVEAAAAVIPDRDHSESAKSTEEVPSFAFLEEIDAKAIAVVLSRELPQTVAVVVAHLPPQQAAAVLQELPSALATDALERIAWIDEPSPEIQSDLIRELRQKLAPHIHSANAGANSLAHLMAVLGAMEYRQRQRVVLQLGKQNTALLHRLGLFQADETPAADRDGVIAMRYRLDSRPQVSAAPFARQTSPLTRGEEPSGLAFEDFVRLDDTALRTVFAAADTEVALLALTGAEPRLIARILRKLPSREADVLRHRLEHPGPLRLRDVEQARFALAAVASRLAHEGAIEFPTSLRFATAV